MSAFITEEEFNSFDGWMKCQGLDVGEMTPDAVATFRNLYDEWLKRSQKFGLMDLRPLVRGEHRYAVAVREGPDLFLALWIRRAPAGDIYVFTPRPDPGWDAHTSYHRDGTVHMKNFGHKTPSRQKRQALETFRGAEPLGVYGGHGPRGVAAHCDPSAFSAVVEVSSGVLGPRDGVIMIDLVEPGVQPPPFIDSSHVPFPFRAGPVVREEVFRDKAPWIVVRIG